MEDRMFDRRRWLLAALAVFAVVFVCGLAAPAQAQTCAPAWSASQVYVAGNTASQNGINYRANWWTQGQSPATNNGPYPGSGQPWTNIGACSGAGGCTVIPSVPGGLTASGVTASSVNLAWNASTSGAGCTVQYNVFVNGVSTYQVSGTSVTASGLAASTTYTFKVSATDQAGTSAQSAQISATTSASGGGGGGGTGTARSAPYVDISLATGSQVASNVSAAGLPGVTLAFLVDGGCTAVWGGGLGNVSNATFPNGTTVKSQIDSLTGAGKKVIISWGGALGSALSSCGTAAQAQAMYQSVFNAYPNITGQDFDIEGGVNTAVLGAALAGLKRANPSKAISLTLPVLPIGLVQAGLDIVNACHSAGFHPDTINVMAMDYGSYYDNGGNMLLSAQQAAQATRTQTGDNIGVTPMIGVNDTSTEIFTISNATAFVTWAKGQSYINRLAFWSLGRDNGGCPGQTWASPTCSGVSQSTWQFSSIFKGF
jgi:chitodextrinase